MQLRLHAKKLQIFNHKGFTKYSQSKLSKFDKFNFKITKVDLVLKSKNGFYSIGLILKGAKTVRAESSTLSFEESLDRSIEKCIKQIKRLKSTHRLESRRERRKGRREFPNLGLVADLGSDVWSMKTAEEAFKKAA